MQARKFYEHNKRSILKTITYRVIILITTYVVVFLATGRHDLTIGITIMANVLNTLVYFLHERVWNTIHWGRHWRKR